jgi:hypothetical protein
MKEFLFLFRGGEPMDLQKSPEKWQAHMQRWMAWMDGMAKAGQLVGAQPLGTDGKQVVGRKKIVTDGPFMEGKEMVSGYLICKAAGYEEAAELAKGCPIFEFEDGMVEVRSIQALPGM